MACEHPIWNSFYRRLASFSRLIIYDLRDVGISDRGDEPPYLDLQMDDLKAVMDAAESESAVLFGCARGSVAAAMFAATYPERVRSLVLYAPVVNAVSTEHMPIGQTLEEASSTPLK